MLPWIRRGILSYLVVHMRTLFYNDSLPSWFCIEIVFEYWAVHFQIFRGFRGWGHRIFEEFCRLIYTVFLLSKQVEILVIKINSVLISYKSDSSSKASNAFRSKSVSSPFSHSESLPELQSCWVSTKYFDFKTAMSALVEFKIALFSSPSVSINGSIF